MSIVGINNYIVGVHKTIVTGRNKAIGNKAHVNVNIIGLKQLPCGRPVIVVRVLVVSKGERKCKVL